MQDSMKSGGRNLQQVLRDLQGSIFFQKTLKRTNAARNLISSRSELGIPRWFIESHSDKFREVVYLKVAGSTSGIWSVRLYIKPKCTETATLPDIKFRDGWNEFATFHGLAENDQLIFSLVAMSKFEVYIFHQTGESKESCFLSPRKEYEAHCGSNIEELELSQQRLGYEESREREQAIREDFFFSGMRPFPGNSQRLFNSSRMSPPSFLKRLTFWNFDNPRGSRRVQTEAVLEIPVLFFRKFGNRIRARVQLQGVGEESPVRNVTCVSKAEKGRVRLYLKAGWGDFAEDNMLRVGQELVFSLTADSFFTVRVWSLALDPRNTLQLTVDSLVLP